MNSQRAAAMMTALAGVAGLLGMFTLLNTGLRKQRTARCPGRALREQAAAEAGSPHDLELAAVLEVAGGVQVIEYVDAGPDPAHSGPVRQPVLAGHHKSRHPVAA